MATYTQNINLKMPEGTERVSRTDLNENSRKTDVAVSGKLNKPTYNSDGTSGQVLYSEGNGNTRWGSVASEEQISAAVTEWLGDNVPTGTTVVLDKSLTIDNAAAGAKATGDALAAVRNDIAPRYSSTGTYAVGDYCMQEGQTYRCIVPIESAENFTASHWVAVDIANDLSGSVSDLKSAIGELNKVDVIVRGDPNYTVGYYVTDTGTLAENPAMCATEYIPVTSGSAVRFYYGTYNSNVYIAEYDTNKTFVKRYGGSPGAESRAITLQSTTKFVRFGFPIGYAAKLMSGTNTLWTASFSGGLESETEQNFHEVQLSIDDLENNVGVLMNALASFKDGNNVTFAQNAGLIITSGGVRSETSTIFYYGTATVTPLKYYRIRGYAYNTSNYQIAAYYFKDSDNNIIYYDSSTIGVGVYDGIVRAPENAVTLIVNGRVTAGDVLIVETAEAYDRYKASPLQGLKASWYGDSIIQNGWWSAVSKIFNMVSTNNGVIGTKISGSESASLNQITRINGEYASDGVAIPSDAELIIIGAGTNDWAQSVPLGERNIVISNGQVVEDVTTFRQACHVMFRNLIAQRPNAKIIVLGTPFGRYANRTGFPDTYGLVNAEGLMAIDYGEALCDIAEMWGIPALRYWKTMGINDSNATTLLDPNSTNGSHLHPTTDAAKAKFVNATLNGLNTIVEY